MRKGPGAFPERYKHALSARSAAYLSFREGRITEEQKKQLLDVVAAAFSSPRQTPASTTNPNPPPASAGAPHKEHEEEDDTIYIRGMLFVFEGCRLRTTKVNGKDVFIATDLCYALGLGNAKQAVKGLLPHEVGITNYDTDRGPRQLLYVTLVGLYRLLFRSNMPAAEKFTTWIAEEVLPAIYAAMQTGASVRVTPPAQEVPKTAATPVVEPPPMASEPKSPTWPDRVLIRYHRGQPTFLQVDAATTDTQQLLRAVVLRTAPGLNNNPSGNGEDSVIVSEEGQMVQPAQTPVGPPYGFNQVDTLVRAWYVFPPGYDKLSFWHALSTHAGNAYRELRTTGLRPMTRKHFINGREEHNVYYNRNEDVDVIIEAVRRACITQNMGSHAEHRLTPEGQSAVYDYSVSHSLVGLPSALKDYMSALYSASVVNTTNGVPQATTLHTGS